MASKKTEEINDQRVRRIARDFRCSVPDVNRALDQHPVITDNKRYLARTLALELVELDELGEVFRDKAIAERDVAAGALLAKLHERRATLLGLNAQPSSAVTVIEHERPKPQSSMDRIYDTIMRISSLPKSEVPGSENDADEQSQGPAN